MNNKNIKKTVPPKSIKVNKGIHQTPKNIAVNTKLSKQTIYILFGIILLTAIAFSNSIKGEFLNWDDKDFIVENSYIKDFSATGIKNIFLAIDKHDPVTAFTHAFTYNYWKLNPAPYHVINLLFHLLNVILVFSLILKLTKRNEAALIAAFLFAVHPMRVESVAWIAERKDVLYAFFYLASLITYINYINKNFKLKYLLFSLILFILSLLSKFSAVTLPVVIILIDYYYGRKFTPKVIFIIVLFFSLSFLRGMVHFVSDVTISGNDIITQTFPFYDRIFMGSYAFIFYVTSIFYFFNLCVLHPYPVKSGGLLPVEYYIDFVLALIFIFFIIWIFIKNIKHKKELIFGIFFFLINIALVLHLIPFGGGVVVADRYSYISYIGIFFLFGQVFCWLTDKSYKYANKFKVYVYSFMTIFIFFCFITTYNRNNIWKNTLSVWSDAVEHFPEHFYGYYGIGNAKSDMGDYEGAILAFNKAIELNPNFSESYYNRGSVKYNHLKDYQGALPDFNKTLEINPNHVTAYTNRGLTKNALKDYKGAIDDFNKAIQLSPGFPIAYLDRANLKADLGDFNGALQDYNKAIELNPNYKDAYGGRGILYAAKLNDINKALSDFNRVIEFDPNDSKAYMNRGLTKLNNKDLNGACLDWQKSAQLGYETANELIKKYCK